MCYKAADVLSVSDSLISECTYVVSKIRTSEQGRKSWSVIVSGINVDTQKKEHVYFDYHTGANGTGLWCGTQHLLGNLQFSSSRANVLAEMANRHGIDPSS